MKATIITTIILSSLTFFHGCSEVSPSPESGVSRSSLSVYNIMGINEPNQNPLFVVKNSSSQKYFIVEGEDGKMERRVYREGGREGDRDMNTPPSISDNVEVVSYASYRPKTFRNREDIVQSIERDAKRFLGTKYVWGATGPTKFDCSGFTQWVYRDVGINIPRVSRDQARVGEYVNFKDLRKGDMMFFDTKKEKKGIVTHVGIYLGDGNFIHASSVAKKVVVYNFYEKPYYKERFLWGRRVVNGRPYLASK